MEHDFCSVIVQEKCRKTLEEYGLHRAYWKDGMLQFDDYTFFDCWHRVETRCTKEELGHSVYLGMKITCRTLEVVNIMYKEFGVLPYLSHISIKGKFIKIIYW